MSEDNRKLIQELQLNHGLTYINGEFIPSEEAILSNDGKLTIEKYFGEPLVIIKKSGFLGRNAIVLFPIARVTYYSQCRSDIISHIITGDIITIPTKKYGEFVATKVLVGGKLIIRNYGDMTDSQRNVLKSHIIWALDSVRNSKKNVFQNFSLSIGKFNFHIFEYDSSRLFESPIELMNWMKEVYEDKKVKLISYEDVIPISLINPYTFESFSTSESLHIPEKKIGLNKWIGDVVSVNLVTWIEKFNLNNGLSIDLNKSIIPGKEAAVDFIRVPEVLSKNELYVQAIEPNTDTENFLLENNLLYTIKSFCSFPFFDQFTEDLINKMGYISRKQIPTNGERFIHYIIRIEKVELLLDTRFIEPTIDFRNAIQNALDQLKPYQALKKVFGDFGYLWPQKVILGEVLRKTCSSTSKFNPAECSLLYKHKLLEKKIEELILSYAPSLLDENFSFSDSHGHTVRKEELNDWVNSHGDIRKYDIVGFDEPIALYKILESEQQKEIELVLNERRDDKILLSGLTEYGNLNTNVSEHIRIRLKESLDNREYEVFGTVIDENNHRIEDCAAKFGLYDYRGFSAIIKTGSNFVSRKRRIVWIIVGKPSLLGVFSPRLRKNRKIKTFKTVLKPEDLNPNKETISIRSPLPLIEDSLVLIHTSKKHFDFDSIIQFELKEWSHNFLHLKAFLWSVQEKVTNLDSSQLSEINSFREITLSVCIISPNSEKVVVIDCSDELINCDIFGRKLENGIKDDTKELTSTQLKEK
ncbi:646_t:CDS:2 [Acaulospora morrowiae]|uniref:646_t:CDS:1 n=1 Tax=Acaulospora morrowiae TaxID=94023 RepID=A0A9N9EZ86_9GLOM|nr:646_t:CDS:2 [Acaulospora morrowiae]